MNWENLLQPWHNKETISDDEIKSLIRQWRNAQLEASDWTQLSDVDISNKAAWAAYRQQLRDMLKGVTNFKLIIFPEPPK